MSSSEVGSLRTLNPFVILQFATFAVKHQWQAPNRSTAHSNSFSFFFNLNNIIVVLNQIY